MLRTLSATISQSWISLQIQDHVWVVPAVQSIHILAIAALLFASFSADLAILRSAGEARDRPWLAESFRWTWTALVVLMISGAILLIGEPTRSIMNVFFRIKVVLVILSVVLTLILQRDLARTTSGKARIPAGEERTGLSRGALTALAVTSVLLWITILFCGRFIAYFGDLAGYTA